MSIIEKAAEKLKTLQSEDPAAPEAVSASDQTVPHVAVTPNVKRLQDWARAPQVPAEEASLWHVDLMALKRVGVMPGGDAAARLADELRRIKRPLLATAAGKGTRPVENGHRIMIASAVPGEGKTFTALNLALSLAKEKDFEVLLVDGDIPKCDLTRLFKLERHAGLMDVLTDEQRRPEDVIVHTDLPGLMLVPVGQRNPLAAELFGSQRMERVLQDFSGRNQRRLLLFDSPPLLATSEAQALGTHMGQIILVVAASSTPQQTVKAAIQTLDKAKGISLILNRAQLLAGEDYYGSYYSRYYKDR